MLFKYKGRKAEGTILSGSIEAGNEKQAIDIIHGQGIYVISIQPVGKSFVSEIKLNFKRVSNVDILHFTRQLSTMINAGLSITGALDILMAQTSNSAFKKMISAILKDIEGGLSFSEALIKYPQSFSYIYTSLVKSGEVSGKLPEVLERLALNLEKERDFQQKVKGALIYPVIICIAMVVVLFVMMIFVIPQLTKVYESFEAQLPWNTLLLIGMSNFFVKFWWLLIGFIITFIFFFKSWKKTKAGNLIIDRIMLKLPLFGELHQQVILTEFTRTLGLLMAAGIPVLDGLDTVTVSLSNAVYRKDLNDITKQVKKGLSLGTLISRNPNFPPILGQMITVGEETGKMDQTLLKLSVFFESESQYRIKNLTAAMEPLIMVLLGIGVGFMIMSIMLPMYNLTQEL